ncbi:MAG: LLM class flavin-dependent oxidoreductase [Actinomycetia bacterium]|nr:LLM class flavin-dependent oxidoreductase [Actinomycetes bacterium]
MGRQLRVGVQLPEVERFVPWTELRDMAIAAEDVGFDSLWLGDHLLYRRDGEVTGPWEAWSTLAAIGAVTKRIEIGPLVAATSFHNPAMLAKKAVTIDEISDGRFILGIGAGWNRTEYDAFGFPFDHRASRFEEAFTIIRTLLRDGVIDFEGEYYTLRDCALVPPARPGRPPIMIGSEGPRVLRASLPYAERWNGWYAWYGNTPEGARELLDKVDEACIDVGRDSSEVEKSVTVFIQAPGGSAAPEGNPNRKTSDPISGDVSEVARRLMEFAEVGVDHVQLVVDPITLESIEWLDGVLEVLDQA